MNKEKVKNAQKKWMQQTDEEQLEEPCLKCGNPGNTFIFCPICLQDHKLLKLFLENP